MQVIHSQKIAGEQAILFGSQEAQFLLEAESNEDDTGDNPESNLLAAVPGINSAAKLMAMTNGVKNPTQRSVPR